MFIRSSFFHDINFNRIYYWPVRQPFDTTNLEIEWGECYI